MILFEMGGIQSESALPGDPTFTQSNNNYATPSTKRIYAEFGISSIIYFRFKEGDNHSLGSVFIYVTNLGPSATYPGNVKFSDEGRIANLIYFIRNDYGKVERQFAFFMADESEGLTQAGMARLNQSIDVFVYCILGAQVNVRSSILGSSGSA